MKWGIMLTVAQDLYDSKKFKKCFLALIQLSNQMSHNLGYLDLLYNVQIQLRDFSAASRTLSVLIQKTNSSSYHLLKMNTMLSENRHNEALDIGLFLQTQNLSRIEQKTLFHNLIDIYIVFNDFEGVQETLDTYSQAFSSEAMFKFAQGLLYIQKDQAHEAIQCLRQSVLANPLLDRAWVSLAIMHNKMGDTELALANVEKAIDINDQNPVAIKCYAIWKEQLGEYNLACSKISSYLEKNNFDQEMTKKEIDLFRKLGRNDLAFTEEVKLTYYFGHI
jgi:tetratricopeptide (TPR) repeat protein